MASLFTRGRSPSLSALPPSQKLSDVLPAVADLPLLPGNDVRTVDLAALERSILEAKESENSLIGRGARRSLSFGSHRRKLSSSGASKSAFPLPAASLAFEPDGSPRLMGAADDNSGSPGTTPRGSKVPTPSAKKIKKAARLEAKQEAKNEIKEAGPDMKKVLAALAHQQKQFELVHMQLKSIATNMDSLYVVSTKQLERIYNGVDEIGRTGHIAHADDEDMGLSATQGSGYRPLGKVDSKSSCCALV